MGADELGLCPSCSRHLRVTEDRCPFCDEVIDRGLRPSLSPIWVRRTLAAAAAATAVATLGSKCDEPDPEPVINVLPEPAVVAEPSAVAEYGAPPMMDDDDPLPTPVPPYGVAPIPDPPPDPPNPVPNPPDDASSDKPAKPTSSGSSKK